MDWVNKNNQVKAVGNKQYLSNYISLVYCWQKYFDTSPSSCIQYKIKTYFIKPPVHVCLIVMIHSDIGSGAYL